MNKIIYTKFSNERAPEFAVKTDIVKYEDGSKGVRKSPADKKADLFVRQLPVRYEKIKKLFENTKIVPCSCVWDNEEECAEFEFVNGISLEKQLDIYLEENNYDKLFSLINDYFDICRKTSNLEFAVSEEFESVFGEVHLSNCYKSFQLSNIDMIFENILINEKCWMLIDYEWCFEFAVPVDFILYRALHYYVYTRKSREILIEKGIFDLLGDAKEDISVFAAMEKSFQKYIEGNIVAVRTLYSFLGQTAHNIVKILVDGAPGYTLNHIEIYKNYGDGFVFQEREKYDAVLNGNICKIRISVEDSVKMLRVDPAPCGCGLKVTKFCAIWEDEQEDLAEIVSYNGVKVAENIYIFSNNDPWFWIDIADGKRGIVELEYEINTFGNSAVAAMNYMADEIQNLKADIDKCGEQEEDLLRQIENLQLVLGEEQAKTIAERGQKEYFQREFERLQTENNLLNEEINSIHDSLSWKVTKPLRNTKEIFKAK